MPSSVSPFMQVSGSRESHVAFRVHPVYLLTVCKPCVPDRRTDLVESCPHVGRYRLLGRGVELDVGEGAEPVPDLLGGFKVIHDAKGSAQTTKAAPLPEQVGAGRRCAYLPTRRLHGSAGVRQFRCRWR